MSSFNPDNRKFTIAIIAIVVVMVYIVRLLSLQVFSNDYKKSADSNAFYRKVQYPARGMIYDRDSTLLVFNESVYDIKVVMEDQHGIDTIDFCNTIGITKDEYIRRMDDIKDHSKNPSYSRFTPQKFLGNVTEEQFAIFKEKLYKFRGFSADQRTVRRYASSIGANFLGYVGEVNQSDIDTCANQYYEKGDFIGKQGIERFYERQLRGKKGVQIMLRDVKGRIQGSYQNGQYDERAEAGASLHLAIDNELQHLGEEEMKGRRGAIVAIEPSTGEVLCMVTAPSYDPGLLIGPNRSKVFSQLLLDPDRPLMNRAIQGMYSPGSTFKTSQALTFLQEGIITTGTSFPCVGGFRKDGGKVLLGCHGHASPAALKFAIQTSCNGYFCWGFYHMMNKTSKYGSKEAAFTKWKDYMVSMGFGYKLGIDLPSEKRGLIPNAQFYDEVYAKSGGWTALKIISDAIGQGEVMLTPLQIANLGATIANRGYYYTPHIVRSIEGRALDTTYTKRHYTMVDPRFYAPVVEGMRAAVTSGTCRNSSFGDYIACGKTGTTQNSSGRDHSVFMGFAPMDNPKIAIAVYVENGGFGATVAVPVGARLIRNYLDRYFKKVPPPSDAKDKAKA